MYIKLPDSAFIKVAKMFGVDDVQIVGDEDAFMLNFRLGPFLMNTWRAEDDSNGIFISKPVGHVKFNFYDFNYYYRLNDD